MVITIKPKRKCHLQRRRLYILYAQKCVTLNDAYVTMLIRFVQCTTHTMRYGQEGAAIICFNIERGKQTKLYGPQINAEKYLQVARPGSNPGSVLLNKLTHCLGIWYNL